MGISEEEGLKSNEQASTKRSEREQQNKPKES